MKIHQILARVLCVVALLTVGAGSGFANQAGDTTTTDTQQIESLTVMDTAAAEKLDAEIQNEVENILNGEDKSTDDALTSTHAYTIGLGIFAGAMVADLLGGGGVFTLGATLAGGYLGVVTGDLINSFSD